MLPWNIVTASYLLNRNLPVKLPESPFSKLALSYIAGLFEFPRPGPAPPPSVITVIESCSFKLAADAILTVFIEPWSSFVVTVAPVSVMIVESLSGVSSEPQPEFISEGGPEG